MLISVYNDTNKSINFGCQLVSKSIREVISNVFPDATVEYIPMHEKNARDNKPDLVIINGEGSFGRKDKKLPDGFTILKNIHNKFKNTVPVYLVNTTIQTTDTVIKKYTPFLAKCKLVTLREPLSYSFLKEKTDLTNIKVFPDLGCYRFKDNVTVEKDLDIVFGFGSLLKSYSKDKEKEPVKKYVEIFNELADEGYRIAVLDFPGNPKGDLKVLEPFLSDKIQKVKGTFEDYFHTVSRAKLNVTGRHHGAVMSFIGRTPFYTFESNMWKTEGDQLLYGPFNKFNFREITKEELKSNILNEYRKYEEYRKHIDRRFNELYDLFDGHIRVIKNNELQGI